MAFITANDGSAPPGCVDELLGGVELLVGGVELLVGVGVGVGVAVAVPVGSSAGCAWTAPAMPVSGTLTQMAAIAAVTTKSIRREPRKLPN
ncbi:hypothetical protein [Humibacter antri]